MRSPNLPRLAAWLPLAALIPQMNAAQPSVLNWSQLPPLPDPVGFAAPFAGVVDGALLVAGGANFPEGRPWTGATKVWHDTIYLLADPAGQWHVNGLKLPRPLGYGVSLTLDWGVVCLGGGDANRHYRDGFVIYRLNGRLYREEMPPLPRPVANHCGALVGDTIYLAGGLESPTATNTLRTFWSVKARREFLDWESLAPWPGRPRMLAVAAAHQGGFYLFGGTDLIPDGKGGTTREYLTDAWRYSPATGWKRLADLPRPCVAAPSPAFVSPEGRILIVGGDHGEFATRNNELKDRHPGFPDDILAYDPKTDRWSVAGRFPKRLGPDPANDPNAGDWPAVTVPTVEWKGRQVVPSGEVRPGVRTPKVWSARFGP